MEIKLLQFDEEQFRRYLDRLKDEIIYTVLEREKAPITARELMDRLEIGEKALSARIKEGLPFHYFGKKKIFFWEEVNRWIRGAGV